MWLGYSIYVLLCLGQIDRSQYWIGFNDIQTQMVFQWNDGSPVRFTNWAEHEPNNWLSRKEDCVTIFLRVRIITDR